jgi:hypothetical protein
MSYDAKEAAQNEVRQAVRLVAIDDLLQPAQVTRVVRRIAAVGVDQDVDVRKRHPSNPAARSMVTLTT